MRAVTRREREIARTREDILEAAARAFARSGYHSATMHDIAREAGYSAPSLYGYFESKSEIVQATYDLLSSELSEAFAKPLPSGLPFAKRLEVMLGRQLEVAERRRPFIAFLLTVPPNVACQVDLEGPGIHPFEVRVLRIAEWLAREAGESDLGGHAPDTAARLLVALVFAYVHRVPDSGTETFYVHAVPEIVELFFHGVHGRARRAEHAGEPG